MAFRPISVARLRQVALSLGLLTSLLVGCLKVSDKNQAIAETAHNLGLWGDYIERCHEADIAVQRCETLDDALALLKTHRIADEEDLDALAHDAWKQAFHWNIEESRQGTLIRVTSAGRNGIDEVGRGDDIVAEFTIPHDRTQRVRQSVKLP
jgi:hypothetical protein